MEAYSCKKYRDACQTGLAEKTQCFNLSLQKGMIRKNAVLSEKAYHKCFFEQNFFLE